MDRATQPTAPDTVVFRKWRDTGTIIALFPELPADLLARYCDSYEAIGQHGAADYLAVVSMTTPATAEEYADLAQELARIGYTLRVVQRASRRHHARRMSLARAFARKVPE